MDLGRLYNEEYSAIEKVVFVWCCFKANWKDSIWHGIPLKKGEFITSEYKIAEKTSCSRKQIRTALKNLEKDGFLALERDNQWTKIFVLNYDGNENYLKFKFEKEANEEPTKGQRRATDVDVKEVRSNNTTPIGGVYKLPEPTNPNILVIDYKVLSGIPKEDRTWDGIHFKRCARTASLMVNVCGSVEKARECLQEVSAEFEKKNLSWTMETVLKYASKWKYSNGDR